ncbi:phage/plasmid-like protein TIGR03299 [Haloechinothrix alba]|uniref:Phage/plasmid-like protein TIGR03299 n=1 Tax=Haloechinothrix alba TaxID=664784 RepID=A0A238WDK3_9PSEU|nr:DUF932 domain-containing protein [Haloechinothrix alba]SNR44354.1 phage/plasmid-like protein TIGR03299 [Haloechinothrix alba]
MAHEIETFADGSHGFVSARQPAWHRLGTVFEGTFTAEQAMKHARLGGWNVRKAPLVTHEITDSGVSEIEVPNQYSTLRTNPVTGASEPLGVVGSSYEPVQNEEHADFLDALTDSTGAHLETAGSLRGGRQVFVTCKLPEGMLVGGTDKIDLYIAAMNSHDGSTGFRAIVSPVRIVCANTQFAALRSAQQSWTVRHTAGARSSIEEARKALELSWSYAEEFEAEAERMVQEELSNREWERTLARLFGEVDEDKPQGRQRQKIEKLDTIRGLYSTADTQENIRGTRWAGYQAIVEYVDHYAPTRDDDDERRALRAVSGLTSLKSRAFHELRVPA